MAPENGPAGVTNSEKMCPVLGMVVLPKVVLPSISHPGQPEVQMNVQFNICVKDKCFMWHGEKKDCTLKLGAEALINLNGLVNEHKGKLSLLSMFTKPKG